LPPLEKEKVKQVNPNGGNHKKIVEKYMSLGERRKVAFGQKAENTHTGK